MLKTSLKGPKGRKQACERGYSQLQPLLPLMFHVKTCNDTIEVQTDEVPELFPAKER